MNNSHARGKGWGGGRGTHNRFSLTARVCVHTCSCTRLNLRARDTMKTVHEFKPGRATADWSRKCLAEDLQIAWVYCVAWPMRRNEPHNRYRGQPRVLSFPLAEVEQGKRVERPCDALGHDKRSLRSRGTSCSRAVRSILAIPARYTRGTMDREQVTEKLVSILVHIAHKYISFLFSFFLCRRERRMNKYHVSDRAMVDVRI